MRSLAESFDPRANSIGFLRWFMAFLVIFSHAGPVSGFYSGHDLGVQWSDEQSFGGVAVGGFFFLSGFLITKSRMGRSTTLRFFWRRVLRIFPAFWTALLATAFVLAPIAWLHRRGSLEGYFGAGEESPFTYFFNNMFLPLGQRNLAGMGEELPYFANWGARDWNSSAWTLAYEFGAYIMVGVLGLVGGLADRRIATIVALIIIGASTLQWLRIGSVGTWLPFFQDFYVLLLLPAFAFGMLFALYDKEVLLDWRLAAACLVLAAFTYGRGGFLVVGQFALYYAMMWFAVNIRWLRRWERFGDFSYGIYIYAWPIMTFVTYFGLQERGWIVYHLVVVLLCHVAAFLSWHLIEKPAMSLKNWTPRWLAAVHDPVRGALERAGARVRRAVAPDPTESGSTGA